jgi:2-polyprenyl-6-methoxyphenol hydroxylase-like FAD-dependent oxidoreductase
MRRYRIAVVGFGVAGGATAALLARPGHEVTLFERASSVGPVGAGVLLQPSGQHVLDRLGILEQVAARGERIDELVAWTRRGRQLMRLRYADLDAGLHGLGVHRGDLFAALEALVRGAGVDVRLGSEVKEPPGGFDVVVAADGSRSLLRERAGLTRLCHEYAYGALWAIARSTAVRGRLHQRVHGTRRLIGLLPLGDGRCNVFWSLRTDEHAALVARGFEAWRREAVELCPEAAEALASLAGFEDTSFTTYRHVVVRSVHKDRLVLAGDAAHAMSPHLGQGVNLALVDAWILARALGLESRPEDAFRRYAAERRAQIRYYAWLTLLLTPFFQSGGFVKAAGRDLALPAMVRARPLRRRMLFALSGLAEGFR